MVDVTVYTAKFLAYSIPYSIFVAVVMVASSGEGAINPFAAVLFIGYPFILLYVVAQMVEEMIDERTGGTTGG